MSIYCNQCGAKNDDSARFCEKCGNKLNANASNDNVYNHNAYGNSAYNNNAYNNNTPQPNSNGEEDKPSIGFNILGFLIPLVGFILFFVWKDKTPNKAKTLLSWSVGGFILGLIYALSNS